MLGREPDGTTMTEAERVQLQSSLRRIEDGVQVLGEWKAGAEVRLGHADRTATELEKTIKAQASKLDELESRVDRSAWIVRIMTAVATASAVGAFSQLV